MLLLDTVNIREARFCQNLYKYFNLVQKASVRPALSDSNLPSESLGVHGIENIELKCSSVSDVSILTSSCLGSVLPHTRYGRDRDLENKDCQPQPGPSGYMPGAGRFKDMESLLDISASSSLFSLCSTEDEANLFFDDYTGNNMPFNNWNDINDDFSDGDGDIHHDGHDDASAQDDNDDDYDDDDDTDEDDSVSSVSSFMSVTSNIDYDYNLFNEELVGPHGDDEWTMTGDVEVIIDLDGTQEFYSMQHPPAYPPPDHVRLQPVAPLRVPSDSVLVTDRKRKRSDDLGSGNNQPSKMALVSVSVTSVSCPARTHTSKIPRRCHRSVGRRLRMYLD